MRVIDRYVYAVTRHLPKKMRWEVEEELRLQIKESVPKDPREKEVWAQLEKKGAPRVVADTYLPKKRFGIGADLFDSYKLALKLVLITILLMGIFTPGFHVLAGSRLENGLTSLVLNVFLLAISATLLITGTFLVMERMGITKYKQKKQWTVRDLPELPAFQPRRIWKGRVYLGLVLTSAVASGFTFYQQVVTNGDVISLFEGSRLHHYLLWILLLAGFHLLFLLWQLVSFEWTWKMAVVGTVYNVGFVLLAVTMLRDELLFHPTFTRFIDNLEIDMGFVEGFQLLVVMTMVVVLVSSGAEILEGFRRARK